MVQRRWASAALPHMFLMPEKEGVLNYSAFVFTKRKKKWDSIGFISIPPTHSVPNHSVPQRTFTVQLDVILESLGFVPFQDSLTAYLERRLIVSGWLNPTVMKAPVPNNKQRQQMIKLFWSKVGECLDCSFSLSENFTIDACVFNSQ